MWVFLAAVKRGHFEAELTPPEEITFNSNSILLYEYCDNPGTNGLGSRVSGSESDVWAELRRGLLRKCNNIHMHIYMLKHIM